MARKDQNTVIAPDVDVSADLATINRGEAERDGDTYTLRDTGRRWGQKPSGVAYPIDGPGLYPLGRGAYRTLQILNHYGNEERAAVRLDQEPIDPTEKAEGLRVWRLLRDRE